VPDQRFGKGGRLRQKEPVIIGPRHVMPEVIKQQVCRHDVHQGQRSDRIPVIQRQAVCGACPPVVSDQMKLRKPEVAHECHLIARHGPKAHVCPGFGFGAVSVAAQVRRDDRKIARQRRYDRMPHRLCLGKAVQQQDGRAAACCLIGDGDVVGRCKGWHMCALVAGCGLGASPQPTGLF
jgi:hypothetical protein